MFMCIVKFTIVVVRQLQMLIPFIS